jgi:hypothetical protein
VETPEVIQHLALKDELGRSEILSKGIFTINEEEKG